MSRFTLLIQPDGHALLTTAEVLSKQDFDELRDAFAGWQEGTATVGIIADCEIVVVRSVALDDKLAVAASGESGA